MKKYIFISFIIWIGILQNVNATTSAPDYLIYQKDTLHIRSGPLWQYLNGYPDLERDSIINELGYPEFLPTFIAYWELKNDSLFLKRVKGEKVDIGLDIIFNDLEIKDDVFAWWYNGPIYMLYGQKLFDAGYFEPYPTIYEYELVHEIKEGKLDSTICYDNRKSKQSKYARQDGTLQEFF